MNAYKLFDIIGPRIVGPSSSHTAGAARLATWPGACWASRCARPRSRCTAPLPRRGRGHGTDKALLAGLMGFAPDDLRIRTAYEEAQRQGLDVQVLFSAQEFCPTPTPRASAPAARTAAASTWWACRWAAG